MGKYSWLFLVLTVFFVLFTVSKSKTAKSDSTYEAAQSYLTDFFEDPFSVVNEDPIRDYEEAPDLYQGDIDAFRELVAQHREVRNIDPTMAPSTPRDIIIERSERELEEGTKRAWYDNDDPALILNAPYEDQFAILPTSGKALTASGEPLGWSNDYWPLAYGSLSMRYSHSRIYPSFKEAFNLFQQPQEYLALRHGNNGHALASGQTDGWSPAEKYDLLMGDQKFSLTNYLKDEGLSYARYDYQDVQRDASGKIVKIHHLTEDVAMWMGKCHGWAAAATVVPKVTKDIELEGANGDAVHFHADDIRGLITLKWAQSRHKTKFVGGRCNKSLSNHEIDMDENTGVIYDQECFDVNPGTFHMVLANQVGTRKQSMVMDATFDAEVWNHPIRSFEIVGYFNIKNGKMYPPNADGSIPERAFENFGSWSDKFRSLRANKWRHAHEHATRWMTYKREHGREFRPAKILGVVTSVSYLVETKPTHGESLPDQVVKVVYEYDLELDEEGRIVGGEWYSNKHPDFLWRVEEGSKPLNDFDTMLMNEANLHYDGTAKRLIELNELGNEVGGEHVAIPRLSSEQEGAPLWTIVDYLVSQTGGSQ